jgi:hypothetical protein
MFYFAKHELFLSVIIGNENGKDHPLFSLLSMMSSQILVFESEILT